MANKMTKRDYFTILRNMESVQANPDMVAFIDHELELLAKKNSSEKKPTAQQIANENIKDAIIAGMEPGKAYTVTDIIKSVPACADLTNQKVSALLRLMTPTRVVRTEDKRKAYFSLPVEDSYEDAVEE